MKKVKAGIVFLCVFWVVIFSFGCEQVREENEKSQIYSYVINTNSKKIHKKTCGTGARIKSENRKEYQGDISYLIEQGYTVCGNCF